MSQQQRIMTNRQAGTFLFCLLGCASAAQAQSIIAPPPPYNITPSAVQADESERAGTIFSADSLFSLPGPNAFFNWGPVFVRPHVLYRFLYSTGLQASTNHSSKTFIQQVSPGALFSIGSHWNIDYTPTYSHYTSKSFHDSWDQAVILTGGTHYEDWVLGLTQSYIFTQDPEVATAAQTTTETYLTSANASYRFNSKMALDLGLTQIFTSAQTLTSSRSWSTMDWLNYQFWPRLDGAIGAGFGFDNVDSGPDMTHEQLQARISWRVFDKLKLVVHGGAEDRQFLDSGVSDLISPVYGATVDYLPFEHTTLSLNADKSISPAITSGSQAAETTTISVNAEQRLFGRFSLSLGGAYTQVNYLTSQVGAGALGSRTDTLYTFNSRFSWRFWQRATAALIYTYTDNSSSQDQFAFSSSQVGVELGYRF